MTMNTLKRRLSHGWFALRCCWNAHIALLAYLIYGRRFSKVWVFGGIRGEVYSDNSKVFYEFMLREHPEIDSVWVANSSSSAFRTAPGTVVKKGSFQNYFCFYRSIVAVFSDTYNGDIAPYVFFLPVPAFFYRRILKVRLNHGTISFKVRVKKSGVSKFIRDRIMLSYDLSVASTDLEVNILGTYVRDGTVELLGSARNDALIESNKASNVIFIAPTWRTWLVNTDRFEETEFYINYRRLLTDERLITLLQENNMRMQIYLHHMMAEYTNHFEKLCSKCVSVFDPNYSLGAAIINAKLLITDYSSICAERYVLKKPVAYFQFDRERYKHEIGSYIDLDKNIGPAAQTVDEMVECISTYVDNNFTVSQGQLSGEKYFVYFRDRRNCERIFDAIKRRLETKN